MDFLCSIILATNISIGINNSSQLGYEEGFIFRTEKNISSKHLVIKPYVEYGFQKKFDAVKGYTYKYGMIGYLKINNFLLGGGYGVSGYKSEFDNGTAWKKKSKGLILSFGMNKGLSSILFDYLPKDKTVNQTSKYQATIKVFKNKLFYYGKIGVSKFTQSLERRTGTNIEAGMGLRL